MCDVRVCMCAGVGVNVWVWVCVPVSPRQRAHLCRDGVQLLEARRGKRALAERVPHAVHGRVRDGALGGGLSTPVR